MSSALLFTFGMGPMRAADTAGWMFAPDVMVDVSLTIPQSSMDLLPRNLDADRVYVPATFSMTYTRAGIVEKSYGPWAVTLKVKGMYGSFRSLPDGEKAALKIKFPSGRRPDGLKKFTLNNMVQDGTKVHEVLAYEVFRSMGVAAPRTGYARVTINGVYYGIYLNVETMDSVALPRWYPATGHLYEGSYGSWWGDVADPFSGHYEVDEGSEADRTDLQILISTARGEAKGWLARMHAVTDLDQMTRMWACEWFTGHWDGYSQFITNNYYLHADASGRFTMLPWGADQTFTWANRFDESPDHFIFNNCVRDPIGRAMYVDALQAVADKWVELQLDQRADAAHAMVAGESDGVWDVKNFIAYRLEEHRAWMATLPRPPGAVSVRRKAARGGARYVVSWTPPLRSSGKKAPQVELKGFAVEYRSASGPWARLTVAKNSSSFALPELAPGTYFVRVRGMGSVGDSLPTGMTFTVP